MSSTTGIQWCDSSWNPWWGCVKVAQGCRSCYAEGVAQRFYGRKVWGPNSERRIASEQVWNDPHRWNRRAQREGRRIKVFCLSMGDILEDHPALVEPRKRAIGIIESTPWLDWQLLTKRPENHDYFGWGDAWLEHVWFGCSVAIQSEWDKNQVGLLGAQAHTRFVSYEPAIGPIDFGPRLAAIDWLIVGGESGQDARPCDVEWIRSAIEQCRRAGVACFVKQLGARPHWDGCGLVANNPPGPTSREIIDGQEVHVLTLRDSKGGDWTEWPADLRVREFPKHTEAVL